MTTIIQQRRYELHTCYGPLSAKLCKACKLVWAEDRTVILGKVNGKVIRGIETSDDRP